MYCIFGYFFPKVYADHLLLFLWWWDISLEETFRHDRLSRKGEKNFMGNIAITYIFSSRKTGLKYVPTQPFLSLFHNLLWLFSIFILPKRNCRGFPSAAPYLYMYNVHTGCPMILVRSGQLSYYSGSGNNYGTPCT